MIENWLQTPSKLHGYYTNYHSITKEGDIINVDFNSHKRLVHISVCFKNEPDKEYVSILKSGVILQEREVSRSRVVQLDSRFMPLSHYLNQIPNPDLLYSIGGNYGLIYRKDQKQPFYYHTYTDLKKFNLKEWIQGFLKKRIKLKQKKALERTFIKKIFYRTYKEGLDIGFGVLCLSFMRNHFNFSELAFFSGFYGLTCGALDWFWRGENPFLLKVALFISVSFILIYFQVQYRMWAIFL